jgi:MYXO-CTERM domain-containing protein
MSARATVVRWSVLAGLAGLLVAGRAYAAPTPCKVDLDCPNAGCGGEVCVHSSGLSMCVPANTSGASGTNDGWCASADGGAAVNSNCKCAAMGATCEGFFCSFTVPQGGGTGTGGTGTGTGGSGTGTAGTSGGGDGGCSVAGAPSLAGAGAGLALLAAALRRRRARHRV